MSILINKDTKIITQGITGKTGQFHTEKCQEYANGKNCFVAGVNPKKAGESIFNIPIYASVKEAATQTGATVSVIYVPPAGAAGGAHEGYQLRFGQEDSCRVRFAHHLCRHHGRSRPEDRSRRGVSRREEPRTCLSISIKILG